MNCCFLLLLLLSLLLLFMLLLLMLFLFLLLLIPQTYFQSLVKIGSGTAEKLRALSLCGWVGGGWCKVIFMSNPAFKLSCGWVGVVTILYLANVKNLKKYCIQIEKKIQFNCTEYNLVVILTPTLVEYGLYIPHLLCWPHWSVTTIAIEASE